MRNLQGLAEHQVPTIDEAQRLGEIYDAIQLLCVDKHRMEEGEISVNTWRQYRYRMWEFIEDLIEQLLKSNPGKKIKRALCKIQKGWKHLKFICAILNIQ